MEHGTTLFGSARAALTVHKRRETPQRPALPLWLDDGEPSGPPGPAGGSWPGGSVPMDEAVRSKTRAAARGGILPHLARWPPRAGQAAPAGPGLRSFGFLTLRLAFLYFSVIVHYNTRSPRAAGKGPAGYCKWSREMRTRIGHVPDSLISLSLLLLFLILMAASIAGQARANLHTEARADGCFATSAVAPAPDRTDSGE